MLCHDRLFSDRFASDTKYSYKHGDDIPEVPELDIATSEIIFLEQDFPEWNLDNLCKGSDMEWESQDQCSFGISEILSGMLDMDNLVPNETFASRKRTFLDGSLSPFPFECFGDYDSDGIFLSTHCHEKDLHCHSSDMGSAKRRRCVDPQKSIIPSIAKADTQIPTWGNMKNTVSTDVVKSLVGDVFVFPESSPTAKSPTSSRKILKKTRHPPVTPKKSCLLKRKGKLKPTTSSLTINSTTKPNFSKPLTEYERKQLTSGGSGAVIIRVNKACEFPWPGGSTI
eukprot:m.98053 g.98053  ORF g.98053 m.98053 type:complete len:283 (+) comp16737_c0_seq1:221-1069(+)